MDLLRPQATAADDPALLLHRRRDPRVRLLRRAHLQRLGPDDGSVALADPGPDGDGLLDAQPRAPLLRHVQPRLPAQEAGDHDAGAVAAGHSARVPSRVEDVRHLALQLLVLRRHRAGNSRPPRKARCADAGDRDDDRRPVHALHRQLPPPVRRAAGPDDPHARQRRRRVAPPARQLLAGAARPLPQVAHLARRRLLQHLPAAPLRVRRRLQAAVHVPPPWRMCAPWCLQAPA